MEQNRPILLRIHPNLTQARVEGPEHSLRDIVFGNPAITAQQIDGEEVGYRSTIREAAAFNPGHGAIAELTTELGQQPRLANPGLANEANGLAASVLYLPKKVVEGCEFALAIYKSRCARR